MTTFYVYECGVFFCVLVVTEQVFNNINQTFVYKKLDCGRFLTNFIHFKKLAN